MPFPIPRPKIPRTETELLDVLSGRARGLVPSLLRTGTAIASIGYTAAVAVRNGLYTRGWSRIYDPGIPTISVGNLTCGGTGKTPVVAYLANHLQQQNRRPVILSRGYRSAAKNDTDPADVPPANDEKLVLDRLCPGVPHLQNPNRVASAAAAVRDHAAEVLVLDDGFQHRRLGRTCDLVLIDATQPWGFGAVLPRGLLREPKRSLRRADVVLLTRCDAVSSADLKTLTAEVHRIAPEVPIIQSRFPIVGLVNSAGERRSFGDIVDAPVFAFAGIGQPEAFFHSLRDRGLMVAEAERFPDHHHYTIADVTELEQTVATSKADVVLTTLKDLVKLPHIRLADRSLWAVEIGVEFLTDPAPLHDRLPVGTEMVPFVEAA